MVWCLLTRSPQPAPACRRGGGWGSWAHLWCEISQNLCEPLFPPKLPQILGEFQVLKVPPNFTKNFTKFLPRASSGSGVVHSGLMLGRSFTARAGSSRQPSALVNIVNILNLLPQHSSLVTIEKICPINWHFLREFTRNSWY